jgi:hypothetical protein
MLPVRGGKYLYIGRVGVGGVSGYMWVLGLRLYVKLGWRLGDTVYLGNLSDPLSVALWVRRLAPRPVDVRRLAHTVARALAAARYVAERYRDSPRWRIRTWEALALIDEAISAVANTWPPTARVFWKRRRRRW